MSERLPTHPPFSVTLLTQLESELESLLLRRYGEISEQQLFQLLQLKKISTLTDSQLALFQLHFVLYHLLYRIAKRWAETETAYLEIGLARVKILPWQNDLLCLSDSKQAYYSDWSNYWRMTPLALSERLTQFWQFYQKRYGEKAIVELSDDDALSLLQLSWPCSVSELKKAFRKASLLHHPDRGGDKQRFVRISLAYRKILQKITP